MSLCGWFRIDVQTTDDATRVEAGGGWVVVAVVLVLAVIFLAGFGAGRSEVVTWLR